MANPNNLVNMPYSGWGYAITTAPPPMPQQIAANSPYSMLSPSGPNVTPGIFTNLIPQPGKFNPSCTDPLLELANLHQNYVKGVDALAVSDPNQNLITKKPWLDEPSGSEPFDEQNSIALPGVGSSAIVMSSRFLKVMMEWLSFYQIT